MDRTTHTAALHRLLDLSAQLGPEYGAGLSSHLPMALCALHALGAPGLRLQQFFDRYARRFTPPATASAAAPLAGDWRTHRGRLAAYDALAEHFRCALAAEGPETVLRRTLPGLMTGVGAAAFHGLIRTAYAVDADHPAELASALAYWASRWLPLPAPAGDGVGAPHSRTGRATVDAWTRALSGTQVLPRPDGRLISDRIQQVVDTRAYGGLAGRLVVDDDTLARLAAFALDRYRVSRHFTVLHLVTSAHAMRVIRPWLEDPHTAVAHFADALAAAYLSCGIAPDAPVLQAPDLRWPEVVARAVHSDDEHVIKLVHSCRHEMAAYGGAAYLQAAALVVG